jgi:hypothetical protein
MKKKPRVVVSTKIKVLKPEAEIEPADKAEAPADKPAERKPDSSRASSKERAFYGSFGFYYLDEE